MKTTTHFTSRTLQIPWSGTVAAIDSSSYWYFLTELLTKFRKEFSISQEQFSDFCRLANMKEIEDRVMWKLVNKDVEVEQLAFSLFTDFSSEQMEDMISAILMNQGYAYTSPMSRHEIGLKMFTTVNTPLVSEEDKARWINRFIESVIQRIINRE